MHEGRFVAIDTPEGLKALTKKGEVVEVVVKNMSSTQIKSLKSLDGVVTLAADVEDEVLGQTRLRLRLEKSDDLPSVFDYFFKESIKIINLKQEEPTLEDAFIELTGEGIS
jgi:ABC-2 type transport system ATP-binding protein